MISLSLLRRTGLAMLVAGLLSSPLRTTSASEILFDSGTASEDRWVSSSPSSLQQGEDGALSHRISDRSSLVLAYLTPSEKTPRTLVAGETLRVSYRISFGGLRSGGYFRLGAFDTSTSGRLGHTGGNRPAEDGNRDSFDSALGYALWLDGGNTGKTVTLRTRKGTNARAGLLSSANRFDLLSGRTSFREGFLPAQEYAGVLEIRKEPDGTLAISSSLVRKEESGITPLFELTASAPEGAISSFDTFALATSPETADSLTIHSLRVEVVGTAPIADEQPRPVVNPPQERQLALASVFSDGMVLQRGQPVPVWGVTAPGANVVVEFSGQRKETRADGDGRWRVDLDPLSASAVSRELSASDGVGKDLRISDVLVGEVWLCSGQSNMEWRLKRSDNAESAIAGANLPDVRFFHVPRLISLSPGDTINAAWKRCSPESVPEFSALAYYFGRRIQQDLQVPVGLVVSAWGGTPITGWIPASGFQHSTTLQAFHRQTVFPAELTQERKADRQHPSLLYNGMIHPLVPYAIRGVLWYQGENNVKDDDISAYVAKTEALLASWRQLWGYDFPFYFVQLAPYRYGGRISPEALPLFWEAQTQILKSVPGTKMAVISDTVTKLKEIHPTNKEVAGVRLALIAEADTYGMKVISSGPVFKSARRDGPSVIVDFDFAHGLSTRDGGAPDWFELAGADGVFQKAHAHIIDETVSLHSPGIAEPRAVRFSWHQTAINNLVNGSGLPAPAFRSAVRN